MTRRLLSILVVFAALILPMTVNAQTETPPPPTPPAAPPDENGGSAIYGYLAFAALGGLSLMVLCRSSRRT